MPAKKSTRKSITKKDILHEKSRELQRFIQSNNSYKSLIYGIITVLVLFVVIFLGIRTLAENQKGSVNDEALNTQTDESKGKQYIVLEGDTLWSIAEKEYGNGFAWGEIAKANKITTAETLEKGTKLTIPKVMPSIAPFVTTTVQITPTIEPTKVAVKPTLVPSPVTNKITGNNYNVIVGDTLWDVAVRAYGDGFKWVEIARANNLTNPDLIFPGNKLSLPR